MRNAKRTIGLLFIFTSLIFSGCWSDYEGKEVVKVGFPAVSTSLPLFVAIEEGLFDKRGIKVKPIKFQTANQIVEALVTKRIDATSVSADLPFLSIAAMNDKLFKIYAWEMLDTTIPFDVILSKKGSKIKTIADLENKTIATFPGSQLKHYLKLILSKALGHTPNVRIIEMAPANQISALASGAIDALFTLEPLATIAVVKGVGQIIETSVISKYIGNGQAMPAASFAVGNPFIKNNPTTSKKFVEAMWEAIDLINADQRKYRYLYPKFTPIKKGLANKIPVTVFTKVSNMDLSLFQKEVDILFKAKLINKNFNVEKIVYSK